MIARPRSRRFPTQNGTRCFYFNWCMKNAIVNLSSIFLLVILLFASSAHADVIKLKSGGRTEGIIQQESNEKIILEVKFGKITFDKSNIESIEKTSRDYNDSLKAIWEKEKGATKTVVTPKAPVSPTAVPPKPLPQPVKTEAKLTKATVQHPTRKPGAISIIKCDDGVHSYAVCLPSDYEKRGECPALFCFDPGGDGTQAVCKFAFAAEQYGWIVVGSLNTQNGSWEPILKAQSAMLQDIPKRYKTDDKKYYAAGFSGGARMSYTIAYNNPSKFKGVIACGAGFGQGTISKKVAVYNCAGQTDSNIGEVKKAHAELQRKGAKSELNVFSGGHDWPPDTILKQAVDWIVKN